MLTLSYTFELYHLISFFLGWRAVYTFSRLKKECMIDKGAGALSAPGATLVSAFLTPIAVIPLIFADLWDWAKSLPDLLMLQSWYEFIFTDKYDALKDREHENYPLIVQRCQQTITKAYDLSGPIRKLNIRLFVAMNNLKYGTQFSISKG
jgi:hypothetical protein